MSNYAIDIDISKLKQGIKQVENMERAIAIGIENGIDELRVRLKNKLIEKLDEYGLGGSNLASNIFIEDVGDGFNVSVRSGAEEYYMFVEYGTGIVGSENPHPKPLDWEYDTNSHGEDGWWYPSSSKDNNPTKYMTKNGDWVAWTKGLPSRPFMYQTWLWGARYGGRMIKKHINRELKKIM